MSFESTFLPIPWPGQLILIYHDLSVPNSLVWVHGEHLAHEVDCLVGGPLAHRVERGDAGGLDAAAQHVALGCVAGVLEVSQGRGTQQVRDKVQLLDRTTRLKKRENNYLFKVRIIDKK